MAVADAIPTIVAREMLRTLRADTVWAGRCNTRWSIEAEVGDTIDIVAGPTVSVGAYDPAATATSLTYSAVAPGAKTTINLNQRQHFAIQLDDVYKRQMRPDVLAEGVRQGSAGLSAAIDEYAKGLFSGVASRSIGSVGDSTTALDLSKAISADDQLAVKNAFKGAAAQMTNAHLPLEGRWAVIGPVWQFILTSLFESGQLGNSVLEETVRNGFFGSIYGIRTYLTSNPVSGSGTETVMFGNDYATALVVQIAQMEAIRLETRFADAVRGLTVYGGVNVEDDGIFNAVATYENLPAAS